MKTYILDEAQRSRLMELLERAYGVARNGASIREARAILHAIDELDKAKALTDEDRDTLGEQVRLAWVKWANQQPSPKPSWLVPYTELSEPDKEADRQIGEWIVRYARDHGYLAPSAGNGLSIDDAMEIVTDAYKDGLAGARGGLGRYRARLEDKAKQP